MWTTGLWQYPKRHWAANIGRNADPSREISLFIVRAQHPAKLVPIELAVLRDVSHITVHSFVRASTIVLSNVMSSNPADRSDMFAKELTLENCSCYLLLIIFVDSGINKRKIGGL